MIRTRFFSLLCNRFGSFFSVREVGGGDPCRQLLSSVLRGGILVLLSFSLAGCGASREIPSSPLSISISGPRQLRAGSSANFAMSTRNSNPIVVKWLVNGVAGGSAASGTISDRGQFTAPASPQAVTVSCVSLKDQSVRASIDLEILNPLPEIASVTLINGSGSTGSIKITGSGFVSQSFVSVNGASTAVTVLSDREIQTSPVEMPPSSNMRVIVSNPSPGAADSNIANISTPPSELGDLTGCQNPNTGKPVGDFGTNNTLVYVDDQRMRSLIGTPSYQQNAVYWISRETMPGQSVLLSGAFTGSEKHVRIAEIDPGIINWKGAVNASSTIVPTTQRGTTGLSFKIPQQFRIGVYGFKIEDPLAPPVFGLANPPSITWIVGIPSFKDPDHALQAEIHGCAAEPGEQLRIFGKNFTSATQVFIQSLNGDVISLNSQLQDPTSLIAQVPSKVAEGSYFAWVGNLQWDVTSSSAVLIRILPPRVYRVTHVACSSLIPDGHVDNSVQLQRCLDINAPSQSSNSLTYVDLPPGKLAIAGKLRLPPYEILAGSSSSETQIVGIDSGHQPDTWISVSKFGGISNLSMFSPGGSNLVSSTDCSGDPDTSGHFYIGNTSFWSDQGKSSFSFDSEDEWFDAVKLCGPDIQVYGSSFGGIMPSLLSINLGDGAVVSNNKFDNATGVVGFQADQNVIIETNRFTSGQPVKTVHGNTAIWISRPFASFGPSLTSQNFYISSNAFEDMGSVGNQSVITTDGGGGAYYGPVESSTPMSVTLAEDPQWQWTGVTRPEAAFVVVIYGTGAGQYSPITSWSGRTIVIPRPWQMAPDSSSIVEIVAAHRNLILTHNRFLNNINLQVEMGDAIDLAIEDNSITNSAFGICMRAYGPYGGPAAYGPVMNTDILRNSVMAGKDTLMYHQKLNDVNRSGIGVFNSAGTIVSGVMIRGNDITKEQSIFSTNGCGGISATIIEQNEATWASAGCNVPGFLVQDNLPPRQ